MVNKAKSKWKKRTRAYSMYGTPEAKAKGPFPLSRSKLELFKDCPLCFYADRKLGLGRPGGMGFPLNDCVDHLLKKEFDVHRAAGTPHPYMTAAGINAVPLDHPDLDTWLSNFKGITAVVDGLKISGAVDDMWVSKDADGNDVWHVVDYKATSTKDVLDLNTVTIDVYKQAYLRQMTIYQYLFNKAGFPVSTVGYLVYENADKTASGLGGSIPLKDVSIIEIDTANLTLSGEKVDWNWVEDLIKNAKKCLDSASKPTANPDCEYCSYRTVTSAEI